MVAQGSAHSAEGLQLEEFSIKAGGAQLALRGSLLGPRQDATLVVTDFPAATLHPLYRALPALQYAAPAAAGPRPPLPRAAGNALAAVMQRLEPTLNAIGIKGRAAGAGAGGGFDARAFSDSPVHGLLYVRGALGGSAAQPECQLQVGCMAGCMVLVALRVEDK